MVPVLCADRSSPNLKLKVVVPQVIDRAPASRTKNPISTPETPQPPGILLFAHTVPLKSLLCSCKSLIPCSQHDNLLRVDVGAQLDRNRQRCLHVPLPPLPIPQKCSTKSRKFKATRPAATDRCSADDAVCILFLQASSSSHDEQVAPLSTINASVSLPTLELLKKLTSRKT
jgi:hypothetical protein